MVKEEEDEESSVSGWRRLIAYDCIVFEFFHLVNAFYESVAEHCTARTCGPLLLDL